MKTNINFRQILLTIVTSVLSLGAQADQMGTKDFVPPQDVMPKDILIEQQDIYTISPGGSSHTNYNTTANTKPPVSIWVNHKNNTYAYGDRIVISAKAVKDGYLTIIDVGTSGKIRQLFPNKYQPNNYIRKGEIVQIPATNANFKYTVAGPAGTELIKAFLTDNQGDIYGSNVKLNDDVFPLINADSKVLRKDIITTLNTNHTNRWNSYNKVIYIVPTANANNQNNSPQYVSAMRAEQALKLNKAQIRDIQRYLRQSNFYHGSIDGQIGSKTREAIRAWQRSVNLPATGYIDSETFARIMN